MNSTRGAMITLGDLQDRLAAAGLVPAEMSEWLWVALYVLAIGLIAYAAVRYF
jgi:hypothetical protein